MNELLQVGNGIVVPAIATKGSDNIYSVALGDCGSSCLVNFIAKEVDNMTVVCKKHIEDSTYVFQLDLREELEKEQPKIQKVLNPMPGYVCVYYIHITPDMLARVNPGKYWWSIRIEKNGTRKVLGSNVFTILPDGTDTSGGQFFSSELLKNIDDEEM